MLSIKELSSKKELTEFVKFPLSLYPNHPYWVPPLINDEVASFDKTKNPNKVQKKCVLAGSI